VVAVRGRHLNSERPGARFDSRLFRKGLRRAPARAFVVRLALWAAGVVLAAVRQVTRSDVPGALSGPCGRYLVAVELQQIVGGGD
jgi:hypothetical protein